MCSPSSTTPATDRPAAACPPGCGPSARLRSPTRLRSQNRGVSPKIADFPRFFDHNWGGERDNKGIAGQQQAIGQSAIGHHSTESAHPWSRPPNSSPGLWSQNRGVSLKMADFARFFDHNWGGQRDNLRIAGQQTATGLSAVGQLSTEAARPRWSPPNSSPGLRSQNRGVWPKIADFPRFIDHNWVGERDTKQSAGGQLATGAARPMLSPPNSSPRLRSQNRGVSPRIADFARFFDHNWGEWAAAGLGRPVRQRAVRVSPSASSSEDSASEASLSSSRTSRETPG